MSKDEVRHRLGKALRLLILWVALCHLLILQTCFITDFTPVSPLGQVTVLSRVGEWVKSAWERMATAPGDFEVPYSSSDTVAFLRRTLTLEAGPDDLSAHYDVSFAANHSLFAPLQTTLSYAPSRRRAATDSVVEHFLGAVTLGGSRVPFGTPVFSIDTASKIARIALASGRIPLRLDEEEGIRIQIHEPRTANVVVIDTSEVVVNTSDRIRVLVEGGVPVLQSGDRTVLRELHLTASQGLQGALWLVPSGPPASQRMGSRLNRRDIDQTPYIGAFLLSLLRSLPFVAVLWLLRRYRGHDISISGILATACAMAACFHLALGGQAFLGPLIVDITSAEEYTFAVWPVAAFFVVAIWPSLVRTWERDSLHQTMPAPARSRTIVGAAGISVVLYGTMFLLIRSGSLEHIPANGDEGADITSLLPLALMLATTFALCAWLALELHGGKLRLRLVVGPWLWLIIIGFALAYSKGTDALLPATHDLYLPIAGALLLPFGMAYLRTVVPLVSQTYWGARWAEWPLARRAAAVAALFLVITGMVSGEYRPTEDGRLDFLLVRFAWSTSQLWILFLPWALLAALRTASAAGWERLPDWVRGLGIVLALTFFYYPIPRWLYLLAVFVIGCILLVKWIFVGREITLSTNERQQEVREWVRRISSLHDMERGLSLLKKETVGKLGKGELGATTYQETIAPLQEQIDTAQRQLVPPLRTSSQDILAIGPAVEPWERGKLGARYGFLFALPWELIFLHNFVDLQVPTSTSAWVASLVPAVWAVIQWPLHGFFLGYFFPYLRGSNGIEKGFNLFVVIAAPACIGAVVGAITADDTLINLWFWILQLFIQCILLGVVGGDYETLRRSGLGWRQFFEVHDLGALSAWGSSVLAAIGAAVTALLTSGAGKVISQWGSQILPELLDPKVPK